VIAHLLYSDSRDHSGRSWEGRCPYQQALDAVGGSKKRLDHHELQDGTDAKGGGGGGGGVGDAHRAPHTARAPAQSRSSPTPCYPRGVSAGVGGVSRRRCGVCQHLSGVRIARFTEY